MSWKKSVQTAVRALRRDEAALERELQNVRAKIVELEQMTDVPPGFGRIPKRRGPQADRLSAEGKAAISEAAKKRWAKYRAEKRRSERPKRRPTV